MTDPQTEGASAEAVELSPELEGASPGRVRDRAVQAVRDKGAEAMMAMYRLVKTVQVHSKDNEAVTRTVEQAHRTIGGMAAAVGDSVTLTWAGETIFVAGQLLRAPSNIYANAKNVGALLRTVGISEIAIEPGVRIEAFHDFGVALRESLTEAGGRRTSLADRRFDGISVREIDPATYGRGGGGGYGGSGGAGEKSDEVVQLYASALVVMRHFFQNVAAGKRILPIRVKRLAHRFVALSDDRKSALIGVTTATADQRDDANRAVQTAILSVLVAREITGDRVVLARIALTALMADAGRIQVAGAHTAEHMPRPLTREERRDIPATTCALSIATGGLSGPGAQRTVSIFETISGEYEADAGPLYSRKMTPLLETRIIMMVRATLDRRTPRDGSAGKPILDALQDVAELPYVDPTLFRLFVRAIGLLPTGTVVEFESGDWGVVVGQSINPDALTRPRVKLVVHHSGQIFDPPHELDLGDEGDGTQYPEITRIVDPSEVRFDVVEYFAPHSS